VKKSKYATGITPVPYGRYPPTVDPIQYSDVVAVLLSLIGSRYDAVMSKNPDFAELSLTDQLRDDLAKVREFTKCRDCYKYVDVFYCLGGFHYFPENILMQSKLKSKGHYDLAVKMSSAGILFRINIYFVLHTHPDFESASHCFKRLCDHFMNAKVFNASFPTFTQCAEDNMIAYIGKNHTILKGLVGFMFSVDVPNDATSITSVKPPCDYCSTHTVTSISNETP